MKAPQRSSTSGRTDQMLGAMADILSSFALPSHQWLSDSSAEVANTEEPVPSDDDEEEEEDVQEGDIQQDFDNARSRPDTFDISPSEVQSPQTPKLLFPSGSRCLSEFRSYVEAECLLPSAKEPYAVASSDGSISTSVASLQPQPSTSSAPSSPNTKRSVSTLKKWLTNPVRKLSSGAKVERQVKKLESRPKRGSESIKGTDEGRKSIDLGMLNKQEESASMFQDLKGMEWKDSISTSRLYSGDSSAEPSFFTELLQSESIEQQSTTLKKQQITCLMHQDQLVSYLMEDQDDTTAAPQDELSSQSSLTIDSEEERKSALEKSMYVLRELVETEKLYIIDLGHIVEGYMATMNKKGIPEDMKGKDKIVFGNIHQIYDWHKDYFLGELEKCIEEPDRLATLFIKHERRLHMYVVYCQNKPKSEHIVSEYIDTYFEELKQQLGHRLQLNDLLIKPVQRIMKYQLLLKDFLKYFRKAGMDTDELEKAVDVMCFVPKRCNDMMNVGRLQGFEGKITAQGKLLQQDTFYVVEQDCGLLSRGKERRVFLFEQIVIFSDPIDKKKGFSLPGYIFKNSIKVSSLGFEDCVDGDPCKFALTSRGADRSIVRYILQTSTPEIRMAWIADISQILETQRNFLNALQSPIEYQRRESKSNSLGRPTSSRPTLTTSATMRPHSSASMERNRLPNLKSYNASLPTLYLPSNSSREQDCIAKNLTLQSGQSDRSFTPSPGALTPTHINLDFTECSPTSPKQLSNGMSLTVPVNRTIGIPPHRHSRSPEGQDASPGEEADSRLVSLSMLDEDEL
ncbi:rho guanine nucleotide exchange factor 25 isoform X2 [Protopterus annectens]|uniref:rho guanine nucleotide exchange factor 25 isoform X2 n=1 Tax=Protopterus annectens TaxID=7888 RepID=UPI001CFA3639|nr:rho guanine nucleotide exchange factor 25 isoform X2 [Protopterus annectens]